MTRGKCCYFFIPTGREKRTEFAKKEGRFFKFVETGEVDAPVFTRVENPGIMGEKHGRGWARMDQTQRALLSTLYERWYGVLHRYAQWAVGDALLAEEIVQETFLAAVPKIEELAAGEHPERWLLQTAKYKALHVLREQARQRAKNTVLEESLAAPDQLGQWEDREYAGQLWEKAAALLSPEEVALLRMVALEKLGHQAAAAREIRALSPSPVGEGVEPPAVPFIRPDVWVAEMDGELRVFVNQWDLPQYQVSQTYRQMLRGGVEAETADYLRQKLQQAQWVLTCVQRRRKTLEACVQALVQAQAAYFRGCQAAPGPLLRREVAAQLGVHPSTVTRALRHKYLQCRQGLFPMEYFFARPMGAEGASPQRAKATLARMIQGEDPRRPLSDQALGERLQAAGMPLARRTVAKYRREMGLPPAYRRRR